MPNPPKSLRIGPYDIKIKSFEHAQALAVGRYGEFSSVELTIRVDFLINPIKSLNTLLHEINHALAWISGITFESADEEAIVQIMANGWVQIYRDNPELLEYIREVVG